MENELKELMYRLELIRDNVGVPEDYEEARLRVEEEFDKLGNRITADLHLLKKLIAERDAKKQKPSDRKRVIELNNRIYKRMHEVLNSVKELEEQYKDDNSRKHVDEEEVKRRDEIIANIVAQVRILERMHQENCQDIDDITQESEKIQFTFHPEAEKSESQQRRELVSHAVNGIEHEMTENQRQQLALIERNEHEIDLLLDDMSLGVSELKDHAMAIEDEVTLQNTIIDQLSVSVENTQTHLVNASQTVRKHNRRGHINAQFCVYMCCIIVVFILLTIILSVVTRALKS